MSNQIEEIRTILLSAKYGNEKHPEILECFPNGPKRTIGLVEVTLGDGTKGYGEGYLGVFAPKVFKSIVDLCKPCLLYTSPSPRDLSTSRMPSSA